MKLLPSLIMVLLPQMLHAQSTLTGRWQATTTARIIEFLPDHNLVVLDEEPTVRYVRQPDKSFLKEPVTNHVARVGVYELLPENQLRAQLITGTQSHTRPATWTYRLAGDEVTITEAGTNTVFRRADLPVADAQRPLIGLWRRTGNLPFGYVNMGILFTPGGLGIYIGRSSPWDERSGGGSAGFFCQLVRYRVTEAGKLHETDLQSTPPRHRERDFRITGHRLQLGPSGPYSLHYDQVCGSFAFLDGQFNVQHWLALPPATTAPATTPNK